MLSPVAAAALLLLLVQVLSEGISALVGGKSLEEYNSDWVHAHGTTSLPHRLAGAEATLELSASASTSEAHKQVAVQLLKAAPFGQEPLSHSVCVQVLTLGLGGGHKAPCTSLALTCSAVLVCPAAGPPDAGWAYR